MKPREVKGQLKPDNMSRLNNPLLLTALRCMAVPSPGRVVLMAQATSGFTQRLKNVRCTSSNMFHTGATNNVHRACSHMFHAAARDDVRRRSSNISRGAAFKNMVLTKTAPLGRKELQHAARQLSFLDTKPCEGKELQRYRQVVNRVLGDLEFQSLLRPTTHGRVHAGWFGT